MAIDAILGLNPFCLAWVQKVAKSGGIGTPTRMSQSACLKALIWAE